MSPLRLLLASALCLSLVAGREGANHLVGPGALSTYGGGGGRRRAASYVRVQDPAAGFFVGGSSNEGVNGLYARTERLPASLKGTQRRFSLLYFHMDSGWHLASSSPPTTRARPRWSGSSSTPRAGTAVPVREHAHPAAASAGPRLPASPAPSIEVDPSSWSGTLGRGRGASFRGDARRSGTRLGTDANDVDELPWQLIAVLSDDMLEFGGA